MSCKQDDLVPADRYTLVVSAGSERSWQPSVGAEPSLEELLDDTIMALLWRADGLEPATARATLIGLQALVKRARGRRLGHAAVESVDARRRRSLAA